MNYKTKWLALRAKILKDRTKSEKNIIDKKGYSFEEIINMITLLEENNFEENDNICYEHSDCKILQGITKDRNKFFDLYHNLSKEYREFKFDARKRVDRLLEENKFLMTLCLRYEEENNKLKIKVDSFE